MPTLVSAGLVVQDPTTAQRDAAVLVEAGLIVEIGPTGDLAARHPDAEVLAYADGVVVMAGGLTERPGQQPPPAAPDSEALRRVVEAAAGDG